MAIYSEFSHEKWWFSIAMLVYQSVFVALEALVPRDPISKALRFLGGRFLFRLCLREAEESGEFQGKIMVI